MKPTFEASTLVGLGRLGAIAPNHDGTASALILERLDPEGARFVSELWLLGHGQGDAPTRLTAGTTRDRAPAWLPDGGLLFLSDRPAPGVRDDERRSQVWVLPPRGEAYPLTDEPLGVDAFRVSRDGRVLLVLGDHLPGVPLEAQRATAATRKKQGPSLLRYTSQPVRFWDRWLGPAEAHLVAFDLVHGVSLTATARRDLTPDAGRALHEVDIDLSPDGAVVAASWSVINPVDRIHDRPLALIDTATGARRLLGAEPGVVHGVSRWSPDGRALAVTRYARHPDGYAARTLWRYDAASGLGRELTAAWDRWPNPWAWRGDEVVVTAEDEGRTRLFLVDAHTGHVRPIGPRDGAWSEVALSGDRVVGLRSSLLSPPEVHLLEVGRDTPIPLARLSGFDPAWSSLASARDLRVPVPSDGEAPRSVQTFVVEPTAPNGRTILWIHGGPVAAWGDGWHWRWSALLMAAAGYRVVLPNPAGSTGFGLAWVDDIWGNVWGDRCYRDIMGVVEYLEDQGIAARDTVVMGGSFGGYMTNWIGSQTDRFRLLVTHASIYHMSAFHGVTDVPAWWQLMMGQAPWEAPVEGRDYDRCSPSRHVTRWRTPTLILHGERDYRVPIGEALALFETLQALGVPSELVVFPDEHHWILKPKNVCAWYEAVLEFMERRWDG